MVTYLLSKVVSGLVHGPREVEQEVDVQRVVFRLPSPELNFLRFAITYVGVDVIKFSFRSG
jgi:hypothetical protein